MRINLDGYSREDLQAVIADARKRLKKQIVTKEQRELLTRVKKELAAAGLTLTALKLRRPSPKRSEQNFGNKPPVIHPTTGATWQAGRGRPPLWVVALRKQQAEAAESIPF